MQPPGAGRNTIDPRVVSLYVLFSSWLSFWSKTLNRLQHRCLKFANEVLWNWKRPSASGFRPALASHFQPEIPWRGSIHRFSKTVRITVFFNKKCHAKIKQFQSDISFINCHIYRILALEWKFSLRLLGLWECLGPGLDDLSTEWQQVLIAAIYESLWGCPGS